MNLEEALARIKNASRKMVLLEEQVLNDVLLRLAGLLEENVEMILTENKKDLEKMNISDAVYDRVLLNEKRILAMAESVRQIAKYDSPIGIELEHKILPNGLDLKKVSVPLGVVGVIFEARPNVVIDIFALCFKSRNACVMKGGSQSENSNAVLTELILKAIEERRGENGFLIDTVLLLANDRELVGEFLKMNKYVDVIIPRGGAGLIEHVRQNSTIPVIETGAGVVHAYFDEFGDLAKAREIIFNAKVSRPSVCNALDTLVIHKARLSDLDSILEKLKEAGVEIFRDEESFGKEYLSLKMSVKIVENLDEAIEHINTFGSGHSETIITENSENAEKFLKAVDAACVYVNASTRFTDGGEFGLGAEVGISTQKLHARGPMGIRELTSYKWEIRGNGQVRK
ncbi:MAG: glutamate-5-semialdehyde dehydrogenase [Patescibacteria group bacterium]